MATHTAHWALDKPENNEDDSAATWGAILDAIDDALLSPTEKTALLSGDASALHTHTLHSITASGGGSSQVRCTGVLRCGGQW
jgi:hypothetical protein